MSQFPQLDLENAKGPKAVIKTNRGDITVQLFPEQAPKTVKNFVELAKPNRNRNGRRKYLWRSI